MAAPGAATVAGAAVTLPRMIKRIAFASFLLCLLAACGNKGPLVMPQPAPADVPVQAPEQPVGTPVTDPQAGGGTPVRR